MILQYSPQWNLSLLPSAFQPRLWQTLPIEPHVSTPHQRYLRLSAKSLNPPVLSPSRTSINQSPVSNYQLLFTNYRLYFSANATNASSNIFNGGLTNPAPT